MTQQIAQAPGFRGIQRLDSRGVELVAGVQRHQVNVNCICPGPTDTPLFASIGGDNPKLREALTKAIPFRRLADPKDIAGAILYFAGPTSDYVTGQILSVSGGLTMAG